MLAPTLVNTLRNSSIAVLHFDYTVANPNPSGLPEELKTIGLKTLEWDLQNSNNFIKDMSSVDLLVMRTDNSVVNQWSIEEQIKSFNNTLKVMTLLMTSFDIKY